MDSQSAWVGEERNGKLVALGSPPNEGTYYRVWKGLGGTSAQDLWLAAERGQRRSELPGSQT